MHLEGQQSVLAALKARRRTFELILIKAGATPKRYADILAEAEAQDIPVKFTGIGELDQIAFGKTHGGIVALCKRKHLHVPAELDDIFRGRPGPPLIVILEGVEDGQHLGYVTRTAEALGAHALFLKKHLWDFDETQVSRASSGAFERFPILKISDLSDLKCLSRYEIKLYGCIANAKRSFYEADLQGPVALAVGGEKRGLSGQLRDRCDTFIRIPMTPDSASSLSLTHAACLLLGEAFRQRACS